MFAIITYKYVGGASSGEPVLKVGFSDTVAFDLERKYRTAPLNGEIRDTYFRVSENGTSLITKLLNDPTNARVVVGASGWRATAVIVTAAGAADTARKLSNPNPTVRPALFRAGNASLFKNL